MDTFSYLSVLISIVLGLGITNLLGGVATLLRRRAEVKMYWPLPIWLVTLFLIHVQTWWTMFGLRRVGHWSFAEFLIVLMQPVLLYLMTALIRPGRQEAGALDLRADFLRESRPFFICLFLVLCVSLAKDLSLSGHLPSAPNSAAHGLFLAMAALGAVSRNARLHTVMAPVGLAMIGAYIALLFAELT
jgi:hypothetical protein